MPKFHIEFTDEIITNNTGLILAASVVNSDSFRKAIEGANIFPNAEISDYAIIKSYVGLLCLGKNDYEAIEDYRGDELFKKAFEIAEVPSCSTLRQRLELLSTEKIQEVVEIFNIEMLKFCAVLQTCLNTQFIPVDFDVTPFDNSRSKKEGSNHTYKHFDGYAPMMTYIGQTGFMINNEMREGKAHSNCEGTDKYIENTLQYASKLTDQPLLCRFDSGNDSVKNISMIDTFDNANYIIKKNFRREDQKYYIDIAKGTGCTLTKPRDGKEIYFNSTWINLFYKDDAKGEIQEVKTRIVVRYIVRNILANGQHLLIPETELDAWYTDLDDKYTSEDIEALYKDHGTSEQFHSEFKTDMDMERFPSGKFATNALVLTLGMLAFNILRAIGHETLNSGQLIRKHPVKRIRIRKVLQDIMYMACKLMIKFRRLTIQFANHNRYANAFIYAYARLNV